MVNSLFKYKNPLFWFLFHLFLGLVSTVTPIPLIIYFYLFLLFSLFESLPKTGLNAPLSLVIVYLTSFELLARMAKTSPFIPYELGKYILMVLLLVGIFKGYNKGIIGFLMFILLIPAIFYDYSGYVNEKDIRFNLLGTFNIGLSVIYFYKNPITISFFKKILVLLILPLISVLAFTIFKTPDFDSIEFALGANFDTTGGFGSNQVSTAFGLGLLLSFYMWILKIPISGIRFIDLLLVLFFTFQGLLSFSRGGMIGGAIGMILVIFYLTRIPNNKEVLYLFARSKRYFLPLLILIVFSFILANYVSSGNLLLRYSGETSGTLRGTKEITLNTLTTNRYDIFLSDIYLFTEYGFFGVGAGASKYLRKLDQGLLSHVEMSRLIAEHGFLGIIFCFLVIYIFFIVLKTSNSNIYKGILLALLTVGWYTTFHAATRTYISPLLMGLSLISIVNDKNTLLRKQVL